MPDRPAARRPTAAWPERCPRRRQDWRGAATVAVAASPRTAPPRSAAEHVQFVTWRFVEQGACVFGLRQIDLSRSPAALVLAASDDERDDDDDEDDHHDGDAGNLYCAHSVCLTLRSEGPLVNVRPGDASPCRDVGTERHWPALQSRADARLFYYPRGPARLGRTTLSGRPGLSRARTRLCCRLLGHDGCWPGCAPPWRSGWRRASWKQCRRSPGSGATPSRPCSPPPTERR